jgi:glycosyltransferase involved in cell wall biosynthesis
MRIALVHDHVGGQAGGGGGVRQMLELALALKRLGHDVTIACHDFAPGSEYGNASREIEVRSVRKGVVEPFTRRATELRRQLLGMPKVARLVPEDVDVVNAHESLGLRAGRIAAGRLGVPLVWTRNDETIYERAVVPDETIFGSHRLPSRLVRRLIGLPYRRDAGRSAAIVVLDTRNARMVERSYGRQASIVRSGPAARFFDPPERGPARRWLGVSEGAFVAVGVGILYPHRRFEDLIEAVARLPAEAGVRACIIGSDHADRAYADRLERLIDELRLGDRVELRRRSVSDDDLQQAYAAADVFVFPNQRQTWGLAPLEALAGGTPAIVSSGAGVHEVLEGRAGVAVVPPARPSAIADALIAFKSGGRDSVETTTAWIRDELGNTRYAERMVDVFEGALGAPDFCA